MELETWMFSRSEPIPCQWRTCAERFPAERADVYYDPAYCATWLGWEDGTAVALYAHDEGIEFLYCFLLAEVPYARDPHWRYDAQSFYGYGGIITSAPADPQQLERFNTAIDRWMHEQGVVAEFIRAHPLVHQSPIQARSAEYRCVRTNVYAAPPEAALGALDAATRRNIRRAALAGIRIEHLSAREGALIFSDLYAHTADRIGMDAFYRFPPSYFERCADFLSDRVEYRVALASGEPIAALMLLKSHSTMTYHLGASDERWWHLRPNDMLFASLLEDAAARHIAAVSLGGGTTTDPSDSLYRYKSKFGNLHLPAFVGFRLHHRPTYEKLCAQWEREHPDKVARYGQYFLRYRVGVFERKVAP